MKINWKLRAQNPWFWVGLVAIVLSAMGVEPQMFTSWALVWEAIVDLFTNPFLLFTVVLAVLGVLVDPTTKGASDSERAMRYTILGGTKEEQNGNASKRTK